MTVRDDLIRIMKDEKTGPDHVVSISLTNGKNLLVRLVDIQDDFIEAYVSANFKRKICIWAIAEYREVTGQESHVFKQIEG